MELQIFTLLRQRLMDAYPNLDDDTIRDTLEGATSLFELLANILRSAVLDEALQVGLRSRIDDMKERLDRLEHRSTKKRQIALEAMTEAGLKKLEQPDFTASIRTGSPAVVITSETLIPESYWVPQRPKLNRQALLSELKQGAQIPGAQLSNTASILSVRTK
jgi:hypothetical protein